MPSIEDIRQPVQAEMDAVNRLIIDNLASDVELVENIGHHIVNAPGKRLRPLLALLCAGLLGGGIGGGGSKADSAGGSAGSQRGGKANSGGSESGSGGSRESDSNPPPGPSAVPQYIRFAAVVEFIHAATLLHDDVVDISALRRGRPSANAAFGNAPSVLVGDFLYSRAFQLMVAIGNPHVLREMADTTNLIAEGEVLQLARAGNPDTTEAQYLDVITRKTAVLFAAACGGAATLSGASGAAGDALREFGRHTGIAFQIIDDVLDYEGDPAQMGKNVGDDLGEGKATLPLIHAMRCGDAKQRALIAEAIGARDSSRIDDVLAAVRAAGSLDYARQAAAGHRDQALAALGRLPASLFSDRAPNRASDTPNPTTASAATRCRDALAGVAELAVARSR